VKRLSQQVFPSNRGFQILGIAKDLLGQLPDVVHTYVILIDVASGDDTGTTNDICTVDDEHVVNS
jgi:hypothetical protein